MRLLLPKLFLLLGLAFMIACASTKDAKKQEMFASGEEEINVGYGKVKSKEKLGAVETVNTDNPILTLADYLKRVPGINISGSGENITVKIRGGITSSTMSQEPLFVLDNVPVGRHYQDIASLVDMNDIKRVSVLKDISSTNIYGINGSNGVILITTKRDDQKKPVKKRKKKEAEESAKSEKQETAKGSH